MRTVCLFIAVTVMLCLISPAQAQCPYVPPDSPLLSNGPDDIPPSTDGWVADWQGVFHTATANHQVAFVQTSSNEQKVWFAINVDGAYPDSPPQYPVYYNRRYRANSSSPWYWEWSSSLQVMGINNGFPNAVLYSPTPKYGPGLYKYVMYLVSQPPECNGLSGVGGIAMVSYSNDGICWTAPRLIHHNGGPSVACAPDLGADLVLTEALSVIDAGNTLYLVGMEGDNSVLAQSSNMDKTYASWGYTSPQLTESVTVPSSPMLNVAGVLQPNGLAQYDPTRYKSFAYFFNMSAAWDALNSDLYVSRGYPYPYDRSNGFSNVSGPMQTQAAYVWNHYYNFQQYVQTCGSGLALYPNRYQIYRMHLGDLTNFGQVSTGTWTLVTDRGGQAGYTSYLDPNNSTALVAGQTVGDRDAGAATFIRDSVGNLVRDDSGIAHVLAGNTIRKTLSVGPCRTTGFENERLESLP